MNLPSIYLFTAVLLSACAHHPAEWPIAFLGDSAPTSAATKTIVVQPETKWVNVTGGEIVAFAVGDKRFAWAFNVAAGVKSFDLRRVAPPGTLDRPVETYVAPDPRYIGGDGDSHDGGG